MKLRCGYMSVLGQSRRALLQISQSLALATFRFALQDSLGTWKPNPFGMNCAPRVHPVLTALRPRHWARASPD